MLINVVETPCGFDAYMDIENKYDTQFDTFKAAEDECKSFITSKPWMKLLITQTNLFISVVHMAFQVTTILIFTQFLTFVIQRFRRFTI